MKAGIRLLLVLGLLIAAAVLFVVRMYRSDVQTLQSFLAAYRQFDSAMSSYSAGSTQDAQARAAVNELNAKAGFRISSLIRNDGKLMNQAREIARDAEGELSGLRAYKQSVEAKTAEADVLARQYHDLSAKRKAAYARFQELTSN